MHIEFTADTASANTLVMLVSHKPENNNIQHSAAAQAYKALQDKGLLKNKADETYLVPGLNEGQPNILFVVCGDDEATHVAAKNLGGKLYNICKAHNLSDATIDVRQVMDAHAASVAFGFMLKSWHFDKYFSDAKQDKRNSYDAGNVQMVTNNAQEAQADFDRYRALAEGVFFTRELVSEPGNVLYPETFVKRAQELQDLGVTVEAFGEEQLKKMGAGALLAVGQGSERDSYLLVMQYNGGGDEAPVALVGKGVTFDTGGISIKPSNNMHDMKYDMGGGGVVMGAMKALATMKAPVNVVGVVGLAENMPSGNAQRPGDIVKSLSGQTIECLNTDAEGRMVLADALWYTQDRFKPKWMVDLATLTGAIVVALGKEYAGLFSNNDDLSNELSQKGLATGERLWRLPMGPEYDKEIDSTAADVKNIGNPGTGGSITAAQFLQRFVNNTPWAHLDIASMTWSDKGRPTCQPGATGFGVELLVNMVTGR